jgi:transposase
VVRRLPGRQTVKEPAMPEPTAPSPPPDRPPLRLRRPNRDQVTPIPAYLDAVLPDDHLARLFWAAVGRLDLTAFTATLKVIEGGPGRAAADPHLLLTLWLYATSQGVSSARELDRLCVEHLDYIWLCGGVTVNYHTLSDFRVQHEAALDDLMTDLLGHLHAAGLIAFDQVAQDGIRVRASAGAASYRREPRLQESLAAARRVLAEVAAEAASGEAEARNARQRAARERAAQERVDRLAAAVAGIPAARAAKKPEEQAKARVSTTDPEARVMKMADGGFRPAYNLELAADTAEQVIVGVAVTISGSDAAQAAPMVAQVRRRADGRLPRQWAMDGGFANGPAIDALDDLTGAALEVLAPVQTPKDPARDPHQPLPADSVAVAAWRVRMGTDAAKTAYKLRAATIECVNAKARMLHGLTLLRVRGLAKVRCVALWVAVTHNLKLLVTRPPRPTPALAGAA